MNAPEHWNQLKNTETFQHDLDRLLRYSLVRWPADEAKVSAEFKTDVLTMRLAKNEKAKPQPIEVKIS